MMKSMKRYVSLCVIVVMLIAAVSGCAQRTGGGNGNIRIFFSLNKMDTFRGTLVDAAAERAAQVGAQFVMEDAEGSIEKQVEQIKRAAAEKYDVIICSVVSVDTVVQLKMCAEDIPIVFVNSCPDEKYLQCMCLSDPVSRLPENFRRNMYLESLRAVRRSMWRCSKARPITPPPRAGQMV